MTLKKLILYLILGGCGVFAGSLIRKGPARDASGSSVVGNVSSPMIGVAAGHAQQRDSSAREQPSAGPLIRGTSRKSLELESIGRLYQTMGEDGRLTWGVRDLAGLDGASAEKLQGSLDDAFSRYADIAKAHLQADPGGTNATGELVFTLASFPAEASAIWEKLKHDFRDAAGDSGEKILSAAFHPEIQFAALGRYPMRITYLPVSDSSSSGASFRLEYLDPQSGKVLSQGGFEAERAPRWLRELHIQPSGAR